MPDILHRISIDAPAKQVHDLVASTDGIARWWTGRPLSGEHAVGSSFSVYFGDELDNLGEMIKRRVLQLTLDTRRRSDSLRC